MEEIRMVDLHRQYLNIQEEIDRSLSEVMRSTRFIKGPEVRFFEQELSDYLNINHVISCGNGTDALQAAMMALGLRKGDEVITPNFTFIATVEVVELLGLKPVLVDPDPDTFTIGREQIEPAIGPDTRAIVPVHLFGQCAPMEGILDVAQEHGLCVIEDVAQATGAHCTAYGNTVRAGTLGTVGCTSFFPSKNLGCYGDGGALFTDDQDLAARLKATVNHGMEKKYQYDYIGMNSRLDSLQAAILRVKLTKLDEYNRARQKVAEAYDQAFAPIEALKIPKRSPFSSHIFHQYTLKMPAALRDELKDYLAKKNIPSMIYYPRPLHTQKAYAHLGYQKGDFPVTEQLCRQVLSLPIHTELTSEQLDYIIDNVQRFFKTH